jgi:hypothetical protein
MSRTTRRRFLKRAAGAAGAAAAVGAAGAVGGCRIPAEVADTRADDAEILQLGLALEHEGIFAYEAGLKSGLLAKLGPGVVDLAKKFQSHHVDHRNALAETIRVLGGTPAEAKDSYDLGTINGPVDVVKLAVKIENKAANLYAEAVGKISSPAIRVQAAKILGAEAWHTAVLRGALKEDPAPDWQLTE